MFNLRPMLPLDAAILFVGCKTKDHLREVIDEGGLLWAFDLALPDSTHVELRVLCEAAQAFQAGVSQESITWDSFKAAMLVPGHASVGASDTYRFLNVSKNHFYRLAARKEIRLLTRPKRGPNGSARVDVVSLVNFLARRRYPVPLQN